MEPAFTLSLAVLVAVTAPATAQTPPVLTTTLGDVAGLERNVGGETVQVFYGVPFAQPPVGSLRFMEPVPVEPWAPETVDGTVKPPACWQSLNSEFEGSPPGEMWNPDTEMSEDCLYLNVWRKQPTDGDAPKSIMVWFSGHGFYSGSATLDAYDGAELAARNDVIVVTVAYRLGALGFLYLEDFRNVSGNAGLADQLRALQWIRDQAISLGGSPDDVTLFGDSAGAVSVGLHLFNPSARDLFQHAIMQSGSPLSPWAVMDTATAAERVATLAENVSCPASLDDQVLSCLQDVQPDALTTKQWVLQDGWIDVPLGPIVDGVLIPDLPANMLAAGDVKSTSVIIGVNKDEGIYWDVFGFPQYFPLDGRGTLKKDPFLEILLEIARGDDYLRKQLMHVYFPRVEKGDRRRVRLLDALTGDSLVKCPVVDFANQYAELGHQVYLYSFEASLSTSPWPEWMGVPTGSEIPVVFGAPLDESSANTDQERELAERVMDLWTSFAETGTPECEGVEWPPHTATVGEFLQIEDANTTVAVHLRKDLCDFWSSIA